MKHTCHWCGKPAIKRYPNYGHYCCEKTFYKCPGFQDKMRQATLNSSPYKQLRDDLKAGVAKCYICGEKANYINAVYKACCSKDATDCPGYSKYIGDIQLERYKTTVNYYKGKSRPDHSEALLTKNKFGSYGQYNHWHSKARDLHAKGICTICKKTEYREIIEYKQRLSMHCVNENWTDLSEENWIECCDLCHRQIHKELRRIK